MNRISTLITFMVILATLCSAAEDAKSAKLTYVSSFPRAADSLKVSRFAAIDIDASGYVYIIDQNRHQLLKFTPEGSIVRTVGGFGRGPEQFDDPRDVYASTTLDVYVADYNNNRVVRFDKNLNYLNDFISRYDAPFNFEQVLSVAVSSQYELFLLEDGAQRILKFSRSSEPAVSFGGIYDTDGQLLAPTQLAIDGSRYVFVADPAQQRVVVFDYLGSFVTGLGHPDLVQPEALHWGDDRQLYVVDGAAGEIFIFSQRLRFIARLAVPKGLATPLDLAIYSRQATSDKKLYLLSDKLCQLFYIN